MFDPIATGSVSHFSLRSSGSTKAGMLRGSVEWESGENEAKRSDRKTSTNNKRVFILVCNKSSTLSETSFKIRVLEGNA